MKHVHVSHPRLNFWVTVEIHERDGRYMATADLGQDSRDVGVRDTPHEAVKEALRRFGEPYTSEVAYKRASQLVVTDDDLADSQMG